MADAKTAFRELMARNAELKTADGATLRFVSQSAKAYSKEAEHERALTADDARRMLANIDPNNEMRIVPQRNSHSLAFIARNPNGGWDCTVIATRGGEFYIFKTMFAQTRKPYQDKTLIRYSVGLAGRGNAAGSLIRGLLASVRDISRTGDIVSQSGAPAQGGGGFSIASLGEGLPDLEPSEETEAGNGEARGSVHYSRDPVDVITGMVAAKQRRGKIVTINEVQRLLKSFGADVRLGVEIMRHGKIAEERIGAIVKNKVIDDDTFFELALSEAKKSRVLSLMERAGETGYNLGAEDERNIAALAKAKEDAVTFALANATGFNAVSMELKYGFNMVQSVLNAKYHAVSIHARLATGDHRLQFGRQDDPGFNSRPPCDGRP